MDSDKQRALFEVLERLKEAFKKISEELRDNGNVCMGVGSSNAFGEDQLKADVFSDETILEALRGKCKVAISEETPQPQNMGGEHFTVTFDPLDGSSIIDTNFSVGTIFGIWDTEEIIGASGRDLVFSGLVVYGSRTTLLTEEKQSPLSKELAESSVSEYTLIKGSWVRTKQNLQIASATKMFAPANLRATVGHPGYKELVAQWQGAGYTLRYTGGMVPDIYQIFIKGHGVFSNPTSRQAPAKLRVLYESAPVARLVEVAGGKTYSEGGSVLDIIVESYEQKTGMCVGSSEEVQKFIDLVG